MDILTLGKMNAMARDVDVTLEYLANATFQGLKDVCDVQEGMETSLEATAQAAVDSLALAGPNQGIQERFFYNDCDRGCHCMYGCHTTWEVPDGTKTIRFEAWGGGGAGAGHCCQGCWCDMASCGSQGGTYTRKTICLESGEYSVGSVYDLCMGAGGNGTSHCWTACCHGPRGCATYANGPGLTNFCAAGGQGGYNFYCTCRCNLNHCWQDNMECQGQIMNNAPQCNNVGVPGACTMDFMGQSHQNQFFKAMDQHCDCGTRYTQTGQSHGLTNSITQHIENSMGYCGCETPCRSFRFAGGGLNAMKSYCGNPMELCKGSPGRSGLIKITYA